MRSAEFDKEKVLRAAMHAFMTKGYNKTSMQDLKQATGLHPGSIYCAFENKRGLLLAALAQYNQDRAEEFNFLFEQQQSALAGLRVYLDQVVEECLSCNPQKACLAQKALGELAEQDEEAQELISGQLNLWQQGIAGKILKAQQAGELSDKRDAEHLARYFVLGIYGLRSYAHTHPKPEVLKQLADQLFADICA